MNDLFLIGVFLLCLCIVISRVLSEKGLKILSDDQKVALLDAFSNMRKYGFIPLVFLFVIFIMADRTYHRLNSIAYFFFIGLLITYFIIIQIITSRKLGKLNLPKSYLKIYLTSRIIYYFGFACLLIPIIYRMI